MSPVLPNDPSDEELAHDWLLSEQDLAEVGRCRGADKRLSFAVQLCTLRAYGRFLGQDYGAVPVRILNHVGPTAGRASWHISRRAKLGEVSRDARAVGDHRQQLHAPVALRAVENIDVERPFQKFGPRAISACVFGRELGSLVSAARGGRCARGAMRGRHGLADAQPPMAGAPPERPLYATCVPQPFFRKETANRDWSARR
jgi:hypothetical protein